ncbi:MAG TPA: DUF2207 domain-containing protein [Methylomirabilota bacterium]|nr:DUF2207 domain-containing protein [Methylomirabilota bacterium]
MRRRWPAVAAVLGLLLSTSAAAAQGRSFAIERFAVALDVHPDGSLAVQETLTIDFRGRHHGVFRLIPVRYMRHGAEFALRLDDVIVLDEAHQPLRTEVTYPGRYVRIKAWVPGAENATRTVRILYRVRRGLLFFDDHDELYWNVTGDEWEVPIRQVEGRVALPGGAAAAPVQVQAYTGPRGATGADYSEERRPEGVVFRTTRPLRPHEGLTIVVGWPPGVVARPSAWREAWWLAVDHWPLALPLLTLGAMSLVWRAYGRDPASNRSIKPEYGPPPGLAPAEAGALIDEQAEPRDAVATLVDLAVRGYLHIERVEGDGRDFLFRRVKPLAGDVTLTPIERFVLQKVFGEELTLRDRHLSELRRNYDYVFGPIRDAIYRTLVERSLFPASPYWIRQGWGVAGIVLLFVAGALLIALDRFAPLGWPLPAGVALSGAVVLAFARIMPRRTWRGVRLLTPLRGFQEFLERAEKDRLERLPGDTLHRWLPWAIALGVSERWIFNWQGLRVEAPTWYDGRGPFTLPGYSRDLDAFGRQNEDALLTSRRAGGGSGDGAGGGSSGFSGGSSGGGGGGGGGGTF